MVTKVGTDRDDRLIGTRDDDILIGGDGADNLRGKGGFDTITTGDGPDLVVAYHKEGQITVTDFNPDEDRISLKYINKNLANNNLDEGDINVENVNGGVVISVDAGGQSVFLEGVSADEFDVDDNTLLSFG